ncbi:MAG: hypothetical protein FWF83_04980 [Clostridiales bacterium]|nr:hypothetical protein [Clostridiales bacterium]
MPETFYQAIAEVLAFVYNLKERDIDIDRDPIPA